ncbi:MAG: hypothetical protein JWM97_1625 [Phycisphaerales bacterium]|nr:hypothetical protein [Phycisphaerales bacterium]
MKILGKACPPSGWPIGEIWRRLKARGALDEDESVLPTVLHRARSRPLNVGAPRTQGVNEAAARSHPMGQRTCQACGVRVASTSAWCPACGKSLQRIDLPECVAIGIGAAVLLILIVLAAWAMLIR